MTTDVIAALVAYLKSNEHVDEATDGRVYGGELPSTGSLPMPRSCIVVTPAGGPADPYAYVRVGKPRVDVRCYGPTPTAAYGVHLAAHVALKQMVPNAQAGTMLYNASVDAAALALRDPDTEWPFVLSSWMVLYSERTAP